MVSPAVWLGQFLGAVLAECAPVLVEILREAQRDTVEDGARRDDLRERLLERVRAMARRPRGSGSSGGAGETGGPDPSGNLGG